jgi:hypothetical protein
MLPRRRRRSCAIIAVPKAPALFEFRGKWEMLPKRECLNNRGSCWISDDPERAMYFLQRAAASGYVPVAVNVYNQMCRKVAMGDTLGIRALSENYWSERFEDNAIHERCGRFSYSRFYNVPIANAARS